MSNAEIQTVKEDLIRTKAELGQTQQDLKEIWAVLEKKKNVLFGSGNGSTNPGLVNRTMSLHDIVKGMKIWQNGWREVTNYEDFRMLKQEVKFLSRWNWIIVGGLSLATILIQVFGNKIAEAFWK